MRPLKLEMSGFTTFKKETVVDFEGAEIFVFSGATGSGKSSIIDAMTFALYGSIARYEDLKLVSPVISQGLLLMKVRLDFEINQKKYTAVRVVKKTGPDQATTKEARLECGNEILASSAREMTEKVKELLGLDFDQFNTCLVLPQGQFARFLNEKSSNRQTLLKELLKIGMYDKTGSLARERASVKENLLILKNKNLEEISVTPELLALEKEKSTQLKILRQNAEKIQHKINTIQTEVNHKKNEILQKQIAAKQLRETKIPTSLSLAEEHQKATSQLEKCFLMLKEKETETAKKSKELELLPDPAVVATQIQRYELLSDIQDKISRLETTLRSDENALQNTRFKLEKIQSNLKESEKNYAHLKQTHQVFHLVKDMKSGDPCPVCQHPLKEIPGGVLATDFQMAEEIWKKATFENRETEKELAARENQYKNNRQQLETLHQEKNKIENTLEPGRTLPEWKAVREAIMKIQQELKENNREKDRQKIEYDQTKEKVESLRLRFETLWKEFDQIRDHLSIWKPPVPDRNDYEKTLREFTEWKKIREEEIAGEIHQQEKELNQLELLLREWNQEILEIFRLYDEKFFPSTSWQEWIIQEISRVENNIRNMEDGLEKISRLKKEISELKSEIQLYKSLGNHLKSTGFERWILHEAFQRLVEDGSHRLRELSGGDYSFALDQQLSFDVIDHRNADEKRSCRTLSGGETFLASLALALSLADQVAEFSPAGAARLESMFLDEGFGSLDAETLDTVANTIESLSARGRMIGLVTHVRELAERLPVQYRVVKGPDTSTVEKIIQ